MAEGATAAQSVPVSGAEAYFRRCPADRSSSSSSSQGCHRRRGMRGQCRPRCPHDENCPRYRGPLGDRRGRLRNQPPKAYRSPIPRRRLPPGRGHGYSRSTARTPRQLACVQHRQAPALI